MRVRTMEACFCLVALVLAGCGRVVDRPPQPATTVGVADPSEAPDQGPVSQDLFNPAPVPDHPDPVARAGAAGWWPTCRFDGMSGGWAGDYGNSAVGATPDEALQNFLEFFGLGLPTSSFVLWAIDDGRELHAHAVDGDIKVAVIVARTDASDLDPSLASQGVGWIAETFAACDPAEYLLDDERPDFGRTIWTDVHGDNVPTTVIVSYPGPEPCDWQTATFLRLEGRTYLRDPDGVLVNEVVAPYDGDAELPSAATDTGYRRGGDELWLSADGKVAYVVTATAVEAWPALTREFGCA